MTKEITIIIPVYNGEKYLRRCLDSIVSQSFEDHITLLIDDGSTDGSLAILKEYDKRYPSQFRVISQENSGVAKTRNRGIELAKTKYLMFIDQDDFIDPDYCDVHYHAAEEGGYDVVVSGFKRPGAGQKMINKNVPLKNTSYAKFVCTALWAKLHRTEFVKQNNLRVANTEYGEDIEFVMQEYAATDNIKILEGYVGYNWFYNGGSVSNTSRKNALNMLRPYISLLDVIKRSDTKDTQENEYYALQTAAFYLLWTGRSVNRTNFMYVYDETCKWLLDNYPMFQKNKYLFQKAFDVPVLNRVATTGLVIMYKLHLVRFFAWFYCKK